MELSLEHNFPYPWAERESREGVAIERLDRILERAGVRFARRNSALGGEVVHMELPLMSTGDNPAGALIAFLAEQACKHDEADFWCRFHLRDRACTVWVSDLARSMPRGDLRPMNLSLELARRLNALYTTASPTWPGNP